ncbi:MAG: phosphonate ABC transporter, permease protein PhnE [Puniceicoccaceae bacterium]|jgi:phosphonate transport system permease protein|nr:phosphonate ABC transporter, permease protein PhnE [Puniceicoccaceae bacterium]MBL6838651.1 phosphonate ABC transporter, permease protein PhnE [Puniceicoccaceae bacterium]MBL6912586.1 phosphonate ABC transporter, permease protein PhnE [Puniceicoccaceae bacterium]
MSSESPNSRKADARLPETPWYQRLNLLNTTLLIFMLAVIFSGTQIEGNERDLDVWQNLGRFLADFFPPDLSVVGQTGAALLETVEIAILATFFAIGLSLVIGLGAAQTIAPKWLVVTMRMLLNVIRTIPSLIWAVIAVAAMGANALAGVVALTLYSVGYLGKFFSEAFESVDMKVARSLRGIGADPLQAFQYGIWPHAKPLIWSHSIWMLEYNIRSASIIGYVGAGGLGLQLHAYQEFHQWDRFATVLICILCVVTLLDLLSERIRRRITRRGSPNRPISE